VGYKSDQERTLATKTMNSEQVLLGTLDGDFPFGVLLVTDEGSPEEIPPWLNASEQATSVGSAIAIRVLHEQEGPVSVQVWSKVVCDLPISVFDGMVEVASGVLSVSDALSENALRVPLVPGVHRVEIFANLPQEPNEVCLVLDRGD
jgi:hypothetical protein